MIVAMLSYPPEKQRMCFKLGSHMRNHFTFTLLGVSKFQLSKNNNVNLVDKKAEILTIKLKIQMIVKFYKKDFQA